MSECYVSYDGIALYSLLYRLAKVNPASSIDILPSANQLDSYWNSKFYCRCTLA